MPKPQKILLIKKVIKRNGQKGDFDWDKIIRSVRLAGKDTGAYGEKETKKIGDAIWFELAKVKKTDMSTKEIRDLVEPAIASSGYFQAAKYYILFGDKKERKFKIGEPVMTENAKMTLLSRCSMHGEKGELIESPGQIFWRVARHLAKAETKWSKNGEVEMMEKKFFEKMVNMKFVCTTSAMYEAGNDSCMQQLSPCFVLPIEDSIPAIFKTLGDAALIQKNFGGTGFNFSKIRFKGDQVRGIPNAASGPVDFLQVYSAALAKVAQGGKKHGGNMGILNVNHPDILDFIKVKDEDGSIKNFNISVGVTNEFMDAVVGDKSFNLINPRNNKVSKTIKASKLFDEICEHAWLTGDPGMIFLDRMEEDNFTPTLGRLDATNPCGEQPLLPYESCNLSSVQLANHLITTEKGEVEVNWEELADTVHTVVRFLDNMIETNYYVLPETEKIVKFGNRKIGLGMIGFGEVLYKMKIAYDSKEAVLLADKIGKFVKKEAEFASLELAKIRGVFPNWDSSTYRGSSEKYRNCTMITIAPTGTVSMIAETTNSVEPYFALVYTRRSFYNEDARNKSTKIMYYVVPEFERVMKERGIYSEKLISKVAENHGSVKGLKEIPEDIQKIFVTTHDIDPEWHVRIQAAFQKYADNSISKTINFANSATVDDVKKAYLLAWKLGCKGITIYRDGSKQDQVLSTGISKETNNEGENEKLGGSDQTLKVNEDKCPECGGVTIYESGCVNCRDCGWSECKIA